MVTLSRNQVAIHYRGLNMPVHKVGKDGYQWGKSGKIYKGKDAKKKAEAQGKAILATGWKEKKRG